MAGMKPPAVADLTGDVLAYLNAVVADDENLGHHILLAINDEGLLSDFVLALAALCLEALGTDAVERLACMGQVNARYRDELGQ